MVIPSYHYHTLGYPYQVRKLSQASLVKVFCEKFSERKLNQASLVKVFSLGLAQHRLLHTKAARRRGEMSERPKEKNTL